MAEKSVMSRTEPSDFETKNAGEVHSVGVDTGVITPDLMSNFTALAASFWKWIGIGREVRMRKGL